MTTEVWEPPSCPVRAGGQAGAARVVAPFLGVASFATVYSSRSMSVRRCTCVIGLSNSASCVPPLQRPAALCRKE